MVRKLPLPPEELSKDTQAFYDLLNGENDLSVVLVAASYLDAAVASILHSFFRKSSVSDKMLDARGGVLGNFHARADVAYALNLIDKPLYKDLIRIAQIRNLSAHHHLAVDFSNAEIMKMCAELEYVGSLKIAASNNQLGLTEWMVGPRNQFVLTAVMISQRLLLIALSEQRKRQMN